MIRPNLRRYAIGMFVLSGWMPWGRDLGSYKDGGPTIGRVRKGLGGKGPFYWPICCGHTMTDAEVEAWRAAGLLEFTADESERRVKAGPNLERWVNDAWHGLRARTWAAK